MFRTISWVERSRSSVVMMSIPPPRRSHCSPIWEYADRSSVSAMPPPSLPDRAEAHDRLRRTRGSAPPEQQKDRPPEIRGSVLDRSDSQGSSYSYGISCSTSHAVAVSLPAPPLQRSL